ncbi:DNA gyrase inhibitor GyrI [Sphingomonas jejuensis]|uniref:DNA gyrase inhibitor GyrI n=1 Tax=Sphingomonas jejuensis TaxID=904715 RepID=A0ABX0XN54_9SPHN|nr:heme-binding protein [Sphingomonas jejuensis]NJC34705.1 DNA gyrase inhibitor GyrI [Sphingomonas jejuensis]
MADKGRAGIDPRWIGGGLLAVGIGALAAAYLKRARSEAPGYRPLLTEGDIQLRAYPRLTLASTTRDGGREQALKAGFRTLADYIFAKDRGGERIAMTSPVLNDRDGSAWRTRFVMPEGRRPADLPAPGSQAVTIAEEPARRMAAIRFNGRPDDAAQGEHEARLRRWIAAKGLRVDGDAVFAFYDPPMMPSALRRSEVIIPVG